MHTFLNNETQAAFKVSADYKQVQTYIYTHEHEIYAQKFIQVRWPFKEEMPFCHFKNGCHLLL